MTQEINRKIRIGCLYDFLPRISWTLAVFFAACLATSLINRHISVLLDGVGSDRRFIDHEAGLYGGKSEQEIIRSRLIHSDLPTKTYKSFVTITVSSIGQDLGEAKSGNINKVNYILSCLDKLGLGDDKLVKVVASTNSLEDEARYDKIESNLHGYGFTPSARAVSVFMDRRHISQPITKTGREFIEAEYGGYKVTTGITLVVQDPDLAEQISYKLYQIIDKDQRAPLELEDLTVRTEHKNCRTVDDVNTLEKMAKKISDYHMELAVETTGDSVDIYNLNRYTGSYHQLSPVVYERDDYLTSCGQFEFGNYYNGYGDSGTCVALCNGIKLHGRDFNFSSGKHGYSFGYCFDYNYNKTLYCY